MPASLATVSSRLSIHLTFNQVGSAYLGWFSFQSLYDKIVAAEPHLLG